MFLAERKSASGKKKRDVKSRNCDHKLTLVNEVWTILYLMFYNLQITKTTGYTSDSKNSTLTTSQLFFCGLLYLWSFSHYKRNESCPKREITPVCRWASVGLRRSSCWLCVGWAAASQSPDPLEKTISCSLASRVTAAHMAPYVTVHAFLNNTRELHMSLNASSRRITAAELEKPLHASAERRCNSGETHFNIFISITWRQFRLETQKNADWTFSLF